MRTEAFWFLTIFIVVNVIFQVNAEKHKRQIFREQVSPSRGGKIPEEAFRADRLALNRLNKEGISVPDGVVLDARQVHKHPSPASPMPDVIKVYLTPEGRYVPHEGRYNYEHPKAVDTTYLAEHPTNIKAQGKFSHGYNTFNKQQRYPGHRFVESPIRSSVYKPVLAPLIIPTREDLLQKTYYPTWIPEYSWDVIYEPFDDYFINGIALFNSHQILTDYEGFLTDFHRRSSRNIPASFTRNIAGETREQFLPNIVSPSGGEKSFPRESQSRKPQGFLRDLKKIPATRFTCGEKRGFFADVDTKCQVFHQCAGATEKSSFLCPSGTIFNEVVKRCEWWDSVDCSSTIIIEH